MPIIDLSQFQSIQTIHSRTVDRLTAAVQNNLLDEALIWAWSIFEIESRRLWQDQETRRRMKQPVPVRSFTVKSNRKKQISQKIVRGSREETVRNSNLAHNVHVQSLVPKAEGRLEALRQGNPRMAKRYARVDVREYAAWKYLDEALKYPTFPSSANTNSDEVNGSGYLFANVLVPYLLNDADREEHRWIDEARLLRNADLHGETLNFELDLRHLQVVLEMTEIIINWSWG